MNKIYLGVIAALLAVIVYQYFDIKICTYQKEEAQSEVSNLSNKINDQNDAINKLVIAQSQKQKQIQKAQSAVEQLKKQYTKSANKLLAQKVPDNCNAAMQWGANQGAPMYNCWIAKC